LRAERGSCPAKGAKEGSLTLCGYAQPRSSKLAKSPKLVLPKDTSPRLRHQGGQGPPEYLY
jgi:hypothetical protein